MNDRRIDWFLILAIAQIVLGMLIVVAAFVFWFYTRRESTLFVGTGLTLAVGGGIQRLLSRVGIRLPDYDPVEPEPERPKGKPERRRPR